jgi:hypothetical protein
MLKDHAFCDSCPGCRPAIIDFTTGQVCPNDGPIMIAVNHMWDHETTYAERKAFIEVTVHNSRKTQDVWCAKRIAHKVRLILQAARQTKH